MYLLKLVNDVFKPPKSKHKIDEERRNKKSYNNFRRLVKKHNLSYEVINFLGETSYIKVKPSTSIPQFPKGLEWRHDSWWATAESNIDAAVNNKFSPEEVEWINNEEGFINE